MSELTKQLQPASLAGLAFHVDSAGIEVGRRVQVHEYPQRDKPWAEDLGRATRTIAVEAFVIGLDYIAQTNALIAVAERKGPHALVHPWLGSMQVNLKDPARVRFDAGLGQASISFNFVEAGELAFPAAAKSTPAVSQLAADVLCSASATSFAKKFNVNGLPSFVSDLAGLNITKTFAAAGAMGASFSALQGWSRQLVASVATVQSLMALPQRLGAQVMDYFDVSRVVASLSLGSAMFGPTFAQSQATAAKSGNDPLQAMVLGIVGLAGNGGAGGVLNAPLPVLTTTPARQQSVVNTAATNALVRRALLAQAVGMSSQMDTTVQASAFAVRKALTNALDAESLLADDAVYDALQAARRAVWADVTARASNGARVISVTPAEVMPALVLAYDRYEDASRADEIALRNRVPHLGFLPTRPLQILSV